MSPKTNIRILELNSSDNEYLHKDFHGALCFAVKYLDDTFGSEATVQYLEQVGRAVYQPLIDEIKAKGLIAIETHFRKIFQLEGGQLSIAMKGHTLVLNVQLCPAISYLNSAGQLFTDRYCQTTVHVNKAICDAAGYECSCEYVPGRGCCVQKFWKKGTSQ